MLGLGYPGGPAIERAAEGGDTARFALPVSRTSEPFDFSFSGLKSALRRTIERLGGDPDAPIGWASDGNPGGANGSGSTPPGGGSAGLSEPHGLPLRDLSASFQHAVVAALIDRLTRAADGFPEARALCISGGVSANRVLRSALAEWGAERGLAVWWPPLELCTDNGAMIAAAGARLLAAGRDDGAALDLTLGLSIDSP
jgi:N6-L-threonylcarbamoyladenine synthase